jgi:copper chaperone
VSCGEGQDCEGGCNQWDKAAAEVAKRGVPDNAVWHSFKVEGMTCGGCERRVTAKLGELEGIVSVEADAELGQVRVAFADGKKVVDAAAAKIESLGYRVVR